MLWLRENADWFFSGLGVAIISGIAFVIRQVFYKSNSGQSQNTSGGSKAIQAGRDVKIDKK